MSIEFKFDKCKQAYENAHSNASYKFMSLLPLLVCSNFNWSPYFVIFLPLCHLFTIFVHYFSLFIINDYKGSILDSLRLSMSINGGENHFPKIGSIYNSCQRYFTRFDPRTSFFTPPIRVILYHVELNTYSSFSRSNTRFTSPQTCYMLPLDQVKHRSNSGTIQA
jgi:hypothetical protein